MTDKIVYTADPVLRDPAKLIRQMLDDLKDSRELAWRLLIRNISARYRQTLFGYVWAFLPAAASTVVWVFLKSQNIVGIGSTGIPYPLYVLTGMLLWQGFIDALNMPIRVAVESKPVLCKIKIPYEAFLLTAAGETLFNFLIRLVLLIAAFFWFGCPFSSAIVLAIIGTAVLLTMGLALGTILLPLGLLYEDIQKGLLIITPLWFFITPVIYPPPTGGISSTLILKMNPVSPVLIAIRDWLTIGTCDYDTAFCVIALMTIILALAAWLCYRLSMPFLIERMGS